MIVTVIDYNYCNLLGSKHLTSVPPCMYYKNKVSETEKSKIEFFFFLILS